MGIISYLQFHPQAHVLVSRELALGRLFVAMFIIVFRRIYLSTGSSKLKERGVSMLGEV